MPMSMWRTFLPGNPSPSSSRASGYRILHGEEGLAIKTRRDTTFAQLSFLAGRNRLPCHFAAVGP